MDNKIEILQIEIGKLSLRPGDVLVVRFPEDTLRVEIFDTVESLKVSMKDFNNAVWVLRGGVKIDVIEPVDDPNG